MFVKSIIILNLPKKKKHILQHFKFNTILRILSNALI